MPIPYFRWIKTASPDLLLATDKKQLRSHYMQGEKLVESRSALWVFRLDLPYTPGAGILADRALVKITYTPEGEAIMESKDNHIDFESAEFRGEAQHPLKIIVKSNEQGARGIGATILGFLNARIAKIEMASKKEVDKASG